MKALLECEYMYTLWCVTADIPFWYVIIIMYYLWCVPICRYTLWRLVIDELLSV